ncbi:MAG: hypothetical protein AAB857_01420 [Patescibacteria group bacterium]
MPVTYRQVEFGDDPVQDFIPVGDNSLPDINIGVVKGLGEEFVVHGRLLGSVVFISVQKMEPEIVIRAIEEAIGQPVALAVSQ